eukprot:1742914-Pleurochrysis_carterae.AAC.3
MLESEHVHENIKTCVRGVCLSASARSRARKRVACRQATATTKREEPTQGRSALRLAKSQKDGREERVKGHQMPSGRVCTLVTDREPSQKRQNLQAAGYK